ncbi:Cof-type HAD-IIB family hydrolase [Psittacicella hinzii]|nr:Cof-type HAD-IIB family hydrolase [Psittacicella hinzii]
MQRLNAFDMTNITAVATDLDGTALAKDHKLAAETVNVFNLLVERGIKVILATGRPYRDVIGIEENVKYSLPLVTSNGAMLNNAEPAKNSVTFLPEDIARDACYNIPTEGLIFNVYTRNHWFVNEPNEEVARFFSDSHFDYNLLDLERLDFSKIVKLFFIDAECKVDPNSRSEKLNNLQAFIKERYGDKVECVFSQINCLEINAAGVTKANTISGYLSHFGYTNQENLICFGDGMNDAHMLKSAKYGFVMGNADPKLKEFVKDLDNVTVVGQNTDLMVARICNQLFNLGADLDPYFE